MPTCLRFGYAGNFNAGAASATNYLLTADGTANLAGNTPALFLLPDMVTSDVSQCQAVALSGAEYQSLSSASAPATGGSATTLILPGGFQELANLSIPQAQQLGVEVGVVWAIAWGFRAIARSLNLNEGIEE